MVVVGIVAGDVAVDVFDVARGAVQRGPPGSRTSRQANGDSSTPLMAAFSDHVAYESIAGVGSVHVVRHLDWAPPGRLARR
jgi:hypothetical protein